MNLWDLLVFSFKGLRSQSLRSALTLLGILIGVTLLALVFSVSDSVTYSMANIFAKGGLNNIYVFSSTKPFEWYDIRQLENIPHIVAISPYASFSGKIDFGLFEKDVTLIGVPPENLHLIIPDIRVSEGTAAITTSKSCLVGFDVASEAEKEGFPLKVGDTLYVKVGQVKVSFSVEGLLEKYGFTFIGPIDESLIASYDVIEEIYFKMTGNRMRGYNQLVITVDSTDNVDFVIEQIRDLFGKNIGIFAVKYIVKSVMESLRFFSLIIGSIASVTLIVAAIGVMNAMFTTVMERIRIIGVLRALGLRRHIVLRNILIEALTLASIALAVGLPLGIFIGKALIEGGVFTPTGPRGTLGTISFTVTFDSLALIIAVTIVLTLIGALPPAYRASKLEPAEALRYE